MKINRHVTFDSEVGVLYIYFDTERQSTIEQTYMIGLGLYLDVDKDNNPLGLEVHPAGLLKEEREALMKLVETP